MLEKIFHLLSGYVEFEVLGDSVRFFNITAKSRIGLWGYRRRGGAAVARVKAREYRKLRRVCRRSGTRIRIVRKRGAPFQLLRLKRRKGLVAGAACGVGVYVFLSGFLWGVQVTGEELMPGGRIAEAAARQGIYRGAPMREMNPRGAAHGILAELPGLSWVGVNTDGCFVEVAVKEAQPQPEVEEPKGLSNIVAAREGKVVEIEAESGRPEVELGEAVERGQLLISGLYEEEQDPWAEPLPHPLQVVGPAKGRVVAETYHTFTVQVGGSKKEWVETGEVESSCSLYLLGLRVPLGLPLPPGEGREFREEKPLRVLGVELPVSFDREARVVWKEQARALSPEEQEAQALLKLRYAQKAELGDGGQVLEEEITYQHGEGICILNAVCLCREEIGVVQEVLVE